MFGSLPWFLSKAVFLKEVIMQEVKTNDEVKIQENKMGVMPVKKLVINMALPMMVSMLVQALYNIVDSIFVSHYSDDALSAVSMAFPLQTLLIAVGAGTGVGINALLSRSLGEKRFDKVNKAAANGLFLYVMSWLVFIALAFTIVKPFSYSIMEKPEDAPIADLATVYLTIVMAFSLGLFMQMYFERLLSSTGKTMFSMISQISGAVTNIILDPILIFGLLGLPEMGIAGAAIATVIGQGVAAIVGLTLNLKVNHEISLSLKGFRPDIRTIGIIYAVGFPSIIMQSVGSIMNYAMNKILYNFTADAISVFGVYYKLQSFFFMPVFGMNNAIAPIIAYCYGAEQRKRMIKTIKFSLTLSGTILFVGFLAFELTPGLLLQIFDANDNVMAMGIPALRIIGIHYLVAWYCIIVGTVFQALNRAVYSLVVSIMRQIVVLLPAAYLLSLTGNLNAVWWSFPIAEIMSFLVTSGFFISVYNKIIKKLPEGRE